MMKAVRRRALRLLPLLMAALIFALLFARITMLAQLSERSKQISALEGEIARAQKEIAQQELLLNELHDLDAIGMRAAQLGMVAPAEEQLRVLRLETLQPDAR